MSIAAAPGPRYWVMGTQQTNDRQDLGSPGVYTYICISCHAANSLHIILIRSHDWRHTWSLKHQPLIMAPLRPTSSPTILLHKYLGQINEWLTEQVNTTSTAVGHVSPVQDGRNKLKGFVCSSGWLLSVFCLCAALLFSLSCCPVCVFFSVRFS